MVTHKASIFAPKARRRVDLRLLNFWPYSTYFTARLNAGPFESLHFHKHESTDDLKLYVCFMLSYLHVKPQKMLTVNENQKAFSIVQK